MAHRVEAMIGSRLLSIETGKLAQQASGAVTVRYGDTIVLVTATSSAEPREGIDFLPLTIDYEEKLYAAGKIPGGYIKREGRPSQEAILNGRLADRPLRPLFPKGYRNDVQVVATVLSADQVNDPDLLAIVGASAALSISDIPFDGPVGASRVGYRDGEFILNPTHGERETSKLDLVVAGTRDAVMMVEASATEMPEQVALDAIRFGQEANQELIDLQAQLVVLAGRPKRTFTPPAPDAEVEAAVVEVLGGRLPATLNQADKSERETAVDALQAELLQQLGERFDPKMVLNIFEAMMKAEVRQNILGRGQRPDGRDPVTIRPITCEVGLLPRTHGSGLFTRGQTQVLTIATLGSGGDEQIIDGLTPDESKRFMHHYNFPPFSTGEVKRLGSPGRREIGHGALAERALLPMIPDEGDFPYTVRLVSEVLSSNGSTSMAAVCGSTLALMDAGVPIKSPVAGVAMGLVMGSNGEYVVLTDIQGIEDALGDMDFKVAGTADGITALQMDIKVKGISYDIMDKALAQAREGRLFILNKMLETIGEARTELSRFAPRMVKIKIHPDKIRVVIGPGGKMIRSIIEQTKVQSIDLEDDGTVIIGAVGEETAQKAIKMIEDLTREVEVGAVYTGKVTRLTNFGAFVEILPGKEGLVRIGELADYRVPSVEDVVQVGDEIMVMVSEIDRQGRINLSRRAVLEGATPGSRPPAAPSEAPRPPRRMEGHPEDRVTRLGPRAPDNRPPSPGMRRADPRSGGSGGRSDEPRPWREPHRR